MKKEDLNLSDFEPIESPCVLICSVDKESDLCFGCGRSRDEIGRWTLYTKAERDDVLALLPERLPALHAKLEERRKKRQGNKRRRKPTSE